MFEHFTTLNMRQLGECYGVSSHMIGRWLRDIGLRDSQGRPTAKAHQDGFCATTENNRNGGYYYVWHRLKTIRALNEAGHKRVDVETEKPLPSIAGQGLVGPFAIRQNASHCYEILNSDGTVAVWVSACPQAHKLVELMNIAHRHHKFD